MNLRKQPINNGKVFSKICHRSIPDEVRVGDEFSSDAWPLHSTLVDTFAIDWSANEMIAKLTESLQSHDTADTEAAGEKDFGKNGKVQDLYAEPDQAEKSADLVPRPVLNFSPWSVKKELCR